MIIAFLALLAFFSEILVPNAFSADLLRSAGGLAGDFALLAFAVELFLASALKAAASLPVKCLLRFTGR